MSTVFKVEEWHSGSGRWYVADTHTFKSWHTYAAIFDIDNFDDYITLLKDKYNAEIYGPIGNINGEPENVMFSWGDKDYKSAHQFKLDINRIARKKNYLV